MSKHKYLTPNDLMDLYEAYVLDLKLNPRIQSIPNYGKICELPHQRPQTLKGFMNFCRLNGASVLHYFNNTDKSYNECIEVCLNIKLSIEAEMIELALLGMIKESMTSKILGLKDEVKIETDQIEQIKIITITASEQIETLKHLQQ